MNPHLLTLALATPLEQLLELPNGVRIAASAREHLQRLSSDQLREMLGQIDALITHRIAQQQRLYGDGVVNREEQRDLDWLTEAIHHPEETASPVTAAVHREYLRILALYKLGEVVDATANIPTVALITPLVSALMEALEALLLADLLPDIPSVEQAVEAAWRAGLMPDPDVVTEVKKVKSEAGRHAADIRHIHNRAAKEAALKLYATQTYRTQDEAYHIIGAQVCRAPGTVKNWILAAKKSGDPAQ